MWGVGGAVGGGQDDEKDKKDFSSLWKSISKVRFPEAGYCYDYYYDIDNGVGKWIHWSNKL